jgi:hypothetical protein
MAVKSKTATPEVPADENTQQLATAKASSEAFAAAQELAISRQTDHDNAEMAEAEMESQFSQGDATATASDWSIVQANVTRTEMLSNAAQAAEKRAESAVVNTSVTLAEIILPFVQSALKGVEVRTSFYTPKTPPTTAIAYVIQRQPTEDHGGTGSVGGKVELRYYHPALYKSVEAVDIQEAAKRAHCEIQPVSRILQDAGADFKVDVVPLTILRAQSETPLITREPTSSQAGSNVAVAFACNLADHCQSTHDGPVRGNPANREYIGAAIAVKVISGEASSDVDDAGVRTTTAKLNLSYRRESDLRTVNVDKHLGQLCEDWKGSMVSMFGRVVSAKATTGFPDPSPQPTTKVTVEVVFKSRVR